MVERGIIFCAEMVRAILEGRKSQTRRFARNIHQGWFGREGVIDWAPYHVGDHLWVRETWATDQDDQLVVFYKATDHETCGQPWRSSRFMPKWAARIWVEVTGVKVERLQDISILDAKAEGITEYGDGSYEYANRTSIENFAILWNNFHKKLGERWQDNPWVFAYTLKRIEKGA